MKDIKRCKWAGEDPLYVEYHDKEWGVPVHDDKKHFEFIVLEGAQAGLSWITILKKREGYRKAFANFNVKTVADFTEEDVERLRQDPSIVRNKLKIRGTIKNAKAFLRVQQEFGSFDSYIWGFVNNKTIVNSFKSMKELPAKTSLSETISKDMKKRGFTFVGPTIIYANMQAIGMVNDHEIDCFRYRYLLDNSQQ